MAMYFSIFLIKPSISKRLTCISLSNAVADFLGYLLLVLYIKSTVVELIVMLKLTFSFYRSIDCMRKLNSGCSFKRRLPVTLLFNIALTNYIALNIFLQSMDLSPTKIGREELMK